MAIQLKTRDEEKEWGYHVAEHLGRIMEMREPNSADEADAEKIADEWILKHREELAL